METKLEKRLFGLYRASGFAYVTGRIIGGQITDDFTHLLNIEVGRIGGYSAIFSSRTEACQQYLIPLSEPNSSAHPNLRRGQIRLFFLHRSHNQANILKMSAMRIEMHADGIWCFLENAPFGEPEYFPALLRDHIKPCPNQVRQSIHSPFDIWIRLEALERYLSMLASRENPSTCEPTIEITDIRPWFTLQEPAGVMKPITAPTPPPQAPQPPPPVQTTTPPSGRSTWWASALHHKNRLIEQLQNTITQHRIHQNIQVAPALAPTADTREVLVLPKGIKPERPSVNCAILHPLIGKRIQDIHSYMFGYVEDDGPYYENFPIEEEFSYASESLVIHFDSGEGLGVGNNSEPKGLTVWIEKYAESYQAHPEPIKDEYNFAASVRAGHPRIHSRWQDFLDQRLVDIYILRPHTSTAQEEFLGELGLCFCFENGRRFVAADRLSIISDGYFAVLDESQIAIDDNRLFQKVPLPTSPPNSDTSHLWQAPMEVVYQSPLPALPVYIYPDRPPPPRWW